VLDLTTTAEPAIDDLIGAMTNQRRMLDRLLFRHAEVAMLIAAGEHRWVSAAIDEALEVEAELGAVDLIRAMTAEALDRGRTVGEIAESCSERDAERLLRLAEQMARTLAEVNTYRAQAAAWAGERSSKLSKAIDAAGAVAYSADGSGL
jgi:hypothetical protein